MHRIWNKYRTAVIAALFFPLISLAQTTGTYSGFSPYSVYGTGLPHDGGTAWNRGMGGIGIAARNRRFINIENPAAVSARDTLSFMADFGLSSRLGAFSLDGKANVGNTFNVDDFVISFPMWNHSGMMIGLTPVSDVGYNVSATGMDMNTGGTNTSSSFGNGGLYQLFAGAGATFWNRLSLGLQGGFVFGSVGKLCTTTYQSSSVRSTVKGDSLQVNAFNLKAGLQYEQPLSTNSSLIFGATAQFSLPMGGHVISFWQAGNEKNRSERELSGEGLRLPDRLGAGISYRRADDFSAELDYGLIDGTRTGFDRAEGFSNVGMSGDFAGSIGHSVRAGLEWTPNRNDIRYFLRRCTYRAGVYYVQTPFTVNGSSIDDLGFSLGMTLPVFRYYNGFTLGVSAGRRGWAPGQIKEYYAAFSIGMNIFDIWFQKPRYE